MDFSVPPVCFTVSVVVIFKTVEANKCVDLLITRERGKLGKMFSQQEKSTRKQKTGNEQVFGSHFLPVQKPGYSLFMWVRNHVGTVQLLVLCILAIVTFVILFFFCISICFPKQ